MRTLHERMAGSLLDQMLYSPSAAQALAQTRQDLRGDRIPAAYRDRIGQTLRRAAYWPPVQAAAFLRVHTGLMSGEFAVSLLEVGEIPLADAARGANAERLKRLHPAFSARLNADQAGADADGELCWTQAIRAQRSTGSTSTQTDAGRTRAEIGPCEIPPGCVPLEVGATLPSRTLLHLVKHGGVARWPYESTVVALLWNAQSGGAA
jgi:hypothetical protein